MAIPQELPEDFGEFTKGLPTRENCDPNNPYEMFLWMFVALPYVKGAPLLMPLNYYQHVSKHLHDLGLRLTCENCGHAHQPKLKYQPPLSTDPNVWTSPGRWVALEVPDRDPRTPAEMAVDQLIAQQQDQLFKELYRRYTPNQRKALMDKADDEPQD